MRAATEQEIDINTAAAGMPCPDVVKQRIAGGDAFALGCVSGVAIFNRCEANEYRIVLALTREVTGAQRKQDINDAFAWMFTNTDAETLVGFIDEDNAQCLAMVPQTVGYELTDTEGGKLYTVTKAAWASSQ